MDFSYVGNGEINFHGCPTITIEYIYSTKYAVGSKVYDLISAKLGRLEALIIKKAWYVCDPRTAKTKTLYKDTDNWLHNEYDLCSQAEAIQVVEDYLNKKLISVNRAISDLNC